MTTTKLLKPEIFCVLGPEYFEIIIETILFGKESLYKETEPGRMAYYRPALKTINGYVVTGFKINWSPEDLSENILKENSPFEMIFLSSSLYSWVTHAKSHACLIKVTHSANVKMIDDGGPINVPCLIASEITDEINDDELRKIKSLDSVFENDRVTF